MPKPHKVPVTQSALLQRINRALFKEGQKLKVARGKTARTLGEHYLVDEHGVVEEKVDIEQLARKLKCLETYEVIA